METKRQTERGRLSRWTLRSSAEAAPLHPASASRRSAAIRQSYRDEKASSTRCAGDQPVHDWTLLVEMIIGYEWFVSGVAKFVRGGFSSGLADGCSRNRPAPPHGIIGSLMKSAFVPYRRCSAISSRSPRCSPDRPLAGPFIWLCSWDRVSDRDAATVSSSPPSPLLAGHSWRLTFHLANGGSHPWLILGSGFYEGIDSTASFRQFRS